ncbi:BatD family protein [Pontiella sp.]|uniref:BatD family protein n=1 Tax=Pontiella sp. TaxID=2837462 RepID=UPI0035653741
MRNLKTTTLVLAGSLLWATCCWAADVRMTIEPALISLLDRAVLKVEFIDCKGDALDIPEVDGLDIRYRGPESKYNIVNGKTSSSITHTYLVTPSKVGDYTIGPVSAKFTGGQKELSAKLRVIKKADDQEAQQLSELMFSKISSSREAPHVHEPFDLELNVHIRDGIQIDGNFSIRGGMPDTGLDGDLEWRIAGRDRKEINGSIFNVYTLTTTAKTLTAGTFSFRPEVQLNVVIPRQQRRSWGFDDPFFGDMFGRQETRPYILECNELKVEVRPVPTTGRPDSYTGGVGVFDFGVEVSPRKVKAGEPITIRMRISGRGNLEKITPPTLEDDHNFKLYDARSVATQNPDEIRFEQVVIPKSDVVTNIPPISFSYFNTKTTDFRTITQGPFPVMVEAAPQQAAQVIATMPSTISQKTEILGRDIVYLKPLPKRWKNTADTAWHRTTGFKILLALPALLVGVVAVATLRRNTLANNVALARRQQAPKAARKHIQRAEAALRKQDSTLFYEAMWDALAEYFGHRLNLAPGEVTLPAVLARVDDDSGAIETLFNTIEQRRYGFGDRHDDSKALLDQLTATMRKCERMKR